VGIILFPPRTPVGYRQTCTHKFGQEDPAAVSANRRRGLVRKADSMQRPLVKHAARSGHFGPGARGAVGALPLLPQT
jgi:hypothetical protein